MSRKPNSQTIPKSQPEKKGASKSASRAAMAKATAKSQSEQFIEKARELETNDDPAAFEALFGKLVPPIVPNPKAGE